MNIMNHIIVTEEELPEKRSYPRGRATRGKELPERRSYPRDGVTPEEELHERRSYTSYGEATRAKERRSYLKGGATRAIEKLPVLRREGAT
jgi:hypothetical protein